MRTFSPALVLFVVAVAANAQVDATGSWNGAIEREGKTWRVGMTIEKAGDAHKALVDFPDADGYDREFTVTVMPDGKVVLQRPQPSGIPIVFSGVVTKDEFAGDWTGFGQKAVFKLTRTARPEKFYREQEVSFSNGAVNLSGTLVTPNGKGPFPAVVITHGGTPHERSGYKSWARHFVRQGIAALIYDKRGSGRSTGETRSASMEDLAADAVAGVNLLRTLAEIDKKRIGVAGHSQGGWIAPLASTMSPHVAFVIASAASGVSPDKQSIYHRASVMREAGFSEDAIKIASDLRRRLYVTGRMILDNDPNAAEERRKISSELAKYAKEPWMEAAALPANLDNDRPSIGGLRLLFFDPVPMWEKVKVPVLLIWGDKDTVVPVAEGKAIIEAALRRAGNDRVTVRIVPNVDHAVVKVNQGPGWDFPRVDLDYYEAITSWASGKR
jgi:dipeptidyl aminopeptidase/acylaminoacyl peptidase